VGISRHWIQYALIALLLAIALIATLLVPGNSAGEEVPDIALVMKSLANEFFLTMEQEARSHNAGSREPYRLITNGIRNESDISGQVRIVENMIAQNVDAIIIAPADSRALIPVCERAIRQGIVVINIDNRFDRETLAEKGLSIPFVGPDNRDGARKVGAYLAEHLGEGEGAFIIEGIPTAYNSQERSLGFDQALTAGGVEILARRSAGWDMEQANVVVTSLLNEFPGVDGIACANDSMALGAVAAVKAAGKEKEILVVGFDNISAVRQMLLSGQILATADQFAGRIAVYGIEYALEALRDGVPLEDRQTPVELVTRDSISSRRK
jgi:ribose transport system substrate-binding protein